MCINSKDVFLELLLRAGRWDTIASQRIKRNNITEISEIIDPTLATIFHNWYESG